MGKYTGVLDMLQPLPPEEPAYQQRINALKDALRIDPETKAPVVWTPESMALHYAAVRKEKDAAAEALSAVNAKLTALEQMLVESLDADEPGWGMYGAGPTTVKLASGGSVAVQYEPQGKVEDKEAFRVWCAAPADVCMRCAGPGDDPQHVAVASQHTCQEQEAEGVHCGMEAFVLAQPRGRDEGPYWLCPSHANHYLHNRDCVDVTPEGSPQPGHAFTPGGGLERALQLWPSSMNAIVKERLLAGQNTPPGVAAYVRAKIVYRGGKATPQTEE